MDKKKKPNIDWKLLAASAMMDLIVGLILMILDRVF